MIRVLFTAAPGRFARYEEALRRALDEAGLAVDLAEDHPAGSVDYIVYDPGSGLTDFGPFTRAKAVLNLWAGVEGVAPNPTLRIPLARMVDPAMTQGMTEWVAGHVLRHHLGIDGLLARQDGVWEKHVPPLASERRVAVLGLGALGTAAAEALAGLGFAVSGWSRSAKAIPGVAAETGEDGLNRVLRGADIVVLLVPVTTETESLMDARRLALLPRGAVLINPGRGRLVDDEALLAALDEGRLAHATLDTFRQEPLPPEHPFWSHPRVTVSPHVASETRAETASRVIAENVRRGEAREPLLHLVDRSAGY